MISSRNGTNLGMARNSPKISCAKLPKLVSTAFHVQKMIFPRIRPTPFVTSSPGYADVTLFS